MARPETLARPARPGAPDGVPAARPSVPARRPRRPAALIAASGLVAAALALPLVFLLIEARGVGAASVSHLIFRRLTVVVTILCAVIGTAAAWCVERTNLPGRRVWAVLVVVPLAIPDFVVSFGWASLWTWVQGFRGAVVVMTLAVYPLVYLPVAASLRAADPGQEEVARSLGVGRVRTFARVTLAQARGAILGGSLLVLAGEGMLRGRGRVTRGGPLAARRMPPHRLGRATLPVLAGFAALTALALGVPVGASVYWIFEGGAHAIGGVSLSAAALHTAMYGIGAGILDTAAALPIALLVLRHPGRLRLLLERSTYLVLAMPGVVAAFALSYFAERYANGFLYQSAPLLVVCYAIMFFPLALVGVKASLSRAPASLDEMARSLGQRRLAVLWRVTLRLAGPGLAAAFCLVFLSVVTELTATLLLIPTGVQTLATQFWAYETNLSYGQAAPFALVMIAVAAVPSYVLGRFFDRSAHAQT